MKLKLINKSEFESLSCQVDVYFCNGCLFYDGSDNLVAFPVYKSFADEVYYKVVYD